MLNKDGIRELVYVTIIDGIEPITGSDNCESAIVGGWHIMVHKGQFNIGDPAIYFEIDSRVPSDKECFAFLAKKNYKIKTQRFTFGGKGNFTSQGLLMHAEDFGWHLDPNLSVSSAIIDDKGIIHCVDDESRFLTKQLGVTYADEEDNQRKAPSLDKYQKMEKRHHKLFKHPVMQWLMQHKLSREMLFLVFGKKADKKNGWPSWVKKTDEERIECIPFMLQNKEPWIVSEKVDGSSCTFTMRRGHFGKKNFYVCSRNVCFENATKPCYYGTNNIYWEMAEKYNMYDVLSQLMDSLHLEWVTVQGEIYGASVQKNTYGLDHREFRAFNLITSKTGRWNSLRMRETLEDIYHVPCVPILNDSYILPDTVEELREYVASQPSVINHKIKEGIVCRSLDGSKSFKCVSPEYLMEYHQ